MEFKIKSPLEKENVEVLISDHLKASEWVSDQKDFLLFIGEGRDGVFEVKIQIWCVNSSKTDWILNEIRYALFQLFRQNDILIL